MCSVIKKCPAFLFVIFFFTSDCFATVTAAFSFTNPCKGDVTLFSDLSITTNNGIVQWTWSFDDPSSGIENTSTLESPNHTFASTGTYNVKLVVVDDILETDSITIAVTILPVPQADFSFTEPCFGTGVQFTSLSTAPSPDTVTGWLWYFGDLTTSGQENPLKIYGAANIYLAQLIVTSSNGCKNTASENVHVHSIPIVNINSDLNACQNVSESFVDLTQVFNGLDTAFAWTFGSFGTSIEKNPVFSFPESGVVLVTLSVVSDGGCTGSDSIEVTVHAPPVAAFTFSPAQGIPPLPVTFINLSSASISHSWDFANGIISLDENPLHTFTDTGVYSVCLVTQSAQGCVSAPACSDVTVRQPVYDVALLNLVYSHQGSYLTVATRVANYGNTKLSGITVTADLGGSFSITETIPDTIAPGQVIFYNFKSTFNVNPNDEELFVCVEAGLPDGTDKALQNNLSCSSVGGSFHMRAPFPNPSNNFIDFEFILPESGELNLFVYNFSGKKVAELLRENGTPGINRIRLDMGRFNNGIYICKGFYQGKEIIRQVVKY